MMKGLVFFLWVVLLDLAQADPSELRQRLLLASKELGDEQFAKREAAQTKMQKIIAGKNQEALVHLRDLWRDESNPEIRARLSGLASSLYLLRKRPYFGIRFVSQNQLTLDGRKCLAILVIDVVKDSPSDLGGLKINDLILGIGNQLLAPGSSQDDVLAFFKKQPTGKKLPLRVRRLKDDLIIPVLPGEVEPTKEDQALNEKEFLKWLMKKTTLRKGVNGS